jgi:hypothetical protein
MLQSHDLNLVTIEKKKRKKKIGLLKTTLFFITISMAKIFQLTHPHSDYNPTT